jgi:hypothetical protein
VIHGQGTDAPVGQAVLHAEVACGEEVPLLRFIRRAILTVNGEHQEEQ